jgi:hypothetical protein
MFGPKEVERNLELHNGESNIWSKVRTKKREMDRVLE